MPQSAMRTDLDQLRKRAVMDSLRQAGAAIDELWLTAANDGIDEEVRLAEASQAVHRALIALSLPA